MSEGIKPTASFKGFDAVRAALANAGRNLAARDAVEADLLVSVAPIVAAARSGAPRSDGGGPHAADTIHAVPVEPTPGEVARVAIGPGKKGWYLRFAEIGTRLVAARPFLRPALDQNFGAAVAIFRERTAARWRGLFRG